MPCFAATKQVMMTSTGSGDTDASATEYGPVFGMDWFRNPAPANERASLVPANGIIDDLYINVSTAPDNGAGTQTWTITLQIDGVGTSLGCTISEAETSCTDSDGVSVTAGQSMEYEIVPANTPANSNMFFTTTWNPTTDDETIITGGTGESTLSTSATENWAINGLAPADTPAFDIQQLFPTAGTLKNLYVKLDTAPGAGTSRTFTYGTVDCTISNTDTTCNSAADTQAVTAGQKYGLVTTLTGTPAATEAQWGIVFVPTTSGEFIFLRTSDNSLDTSATEYTPVTNTGDWEFDATEASHYMSAYAMTIKNMYFELETDPGVSGDKYDFTFRVNGGDSSPALSASCDGVTTCNASATVTLSTNDLIDIKVVPTSAPAIGSVLIGVTGYIAPTSSGRTGAINVFSN